MFKIKMKLKLLAVVLFSHTYLDSMHIRTVWLTNYVVEPTMHYLFLAGINFLL